MPTPLRVACLASLLILPVLPAAAQDLHGTVYDSASHRPIASAVLLLMDDADAPRGRTITNDRGQYHLGIPPGTRKLRVLRLGFRARSLAFSETNGAALDIALVPIPALLEKVTVQASRACPRRDDAQSALALLEQARAGLLATVVAAEENPATLKLLRFERHMDGLSDDIRRQSVHIDSVASRKKSFEAAANAAVFVRDGFSRDSAGMRILFGPDAEVLLDDTFASGYCFRIVDADRARPHQVGLGFTAAEGRRGRVDIDGALWIDTLARRLVDIDFKYQGIRQSYNAPTPGGHIHFHEMPNGMVVIQSWVLLLAAATVDTSGDFRHPFIRQTFNGDDVGGEVARAIWSDGRAWKSALATIQLHVVAADGQPTNGVVVRLAETDYIASPDTRGNLEIPDVLPGPYDVVVIDTSLAAAGTTLDAGLHIVAEPDSIVRAVLISPSPEAFQRKHCSAEPSFRWVTATVTRDDDSPVRDAQWEVGDGFNETAEHIYAKGRTESAGEFGFCSELARNGGLQVRVSDGLEPRLPIIVNVLATADRVKIKLPTRNAPPRPR